MRRICVTCEGSGWVRRLPTEPWNECPTCRGQGWESLMEELGAVSGMEPPRNGQQSCGLSYHAKLGLWVYLAAYSDINLARLRAHHLGKALDLEYGVRWLGDVSDITSEDGSSDASSDRCVPGYYAVLIGDPRPKQLPIRTRTSERKEEA